MSRWFSAALNAAKSLQPKGNKEQMLNTLRKQPGVKKEELDFLDLDTLFNGQDVITAEQLQKGILKRLSDAGMTVNNEVGVYMPMANPMNSVPGLQVERYNPWTSRYPEYSMVHEDIPRPTTPQGFPIDDELDPISRARKVHEEHNYVERVPQAGTSQNAYDYDMAGEHFRVDTATINNDNPRLNIGHTRGFTGDLVHDREVIGIDPDGFPVEIPNRREPIFVLDEVQSDLMQGIYSNNQKYKKQLDNKDKILGQHFTDAEIAGGVEVDEDGLIIGMQGTENHIQELADQRKNIPYQKSWPELLLKDAIQEAVDRDAPYIGWLNGARQAGRYGPEEGREAGLKAFYDNRLVNSKLWKELGLEKPKPGVVSTKGDTFYDGNNVLENSWFVKLPQEVKDKIKKNGLPLFSLGALATYGPFTPEGALYEQ